MNEFYAQMNELDEEAKVNATKSQEIAKIGNEQINTFSIKSKVNPEKWLNTLSSHLLKCRGKYFPDC